MNAGAPAPIADCHLHIFDPVRFPYAPDARYRPQPNETATLEQLLAVMDAHGVTHGLLVTPTSGYGTDNAPVAAALASHPGKFRGIAVVDPEVPDRTLAGLRDTGFAGVRLDFAGARHVPSLDDLPRLLGRLDHHGLVVEIQVRDELAAVCHHLRAAPGTFVIDHFGMPEIERGLQQDGFQALLRLADSGRVNVKLSGVFRLTPDHDAVDPFAAAVLAHFGAEHCVWGSDWPFVNMVRRVDYRPALHALDRWITDAAAKRAVLWDTPARLFAFAARHP